MAMRGARWVTAGLADQLVMACANAAMTLSPLGLFGDKKADPVVAAVALGYLVLGIAREFVGSVMLAQASRLSGEPREQLVRDGQAAAFTVGVLAAVLLLCVWAFWRHPGSGVDLSYLVWIAPFLPVALLHDSGRYTYLSDREPARALVIDLVWVSTQAVLIVAFVAGGVLRPGTLLASWGLGACAGAATFIARSRAKPWRGDPRRWIAATKRLSGWFTATAVIGQLQIQTVVFLVQGRMNRGDSAVLRSAQTAILQPVQNFVTAMMGLLVPRSSRLVAANDRAGLGRQTGRIAAVFAGLGALMVAVVVPLAHLVLPHLGPYSKIAPLALPISVQAAIYLLQIPFSAAMRGMQQGPLLFVQYVCFSATSLTGLVVGARHGHVESAAWGLTTGAAVGLAVMIILYGAAVRRLAPDSGHPEPDDAPMPDPVTEAG